MILAVAALASSLALSGCAFGNKAEVHIVRNISTGQEMLDLKRAHDEGALTEAEYLELKQKLIQLADLEGIVDLDDVVDHDHDED